MIFGKTNFGIKKDESATTTATNTLKFIILCRCKHGRGVGDVQRPWDSNSSFLVHNTDYHVYVLIKVDTTGFSKNHFVVYQSTC
jgi:hypothetical protein